MSKGVRVLLSASARSPDVHTTFFGEARKSLPYPKLAPPSVARQRERHTEIARSWKQTLQKIYLGRFFMETLLVGKQIVEPWLQFFSKVITSMHSFFSASEGNHSYVAGLSTLSRQLVLKTSPCLRTIVRKIWFQ